MSTAAADEYRRLQSDSRHAVLLAAVDRVLDRLDADPTDPTLSRTVFVSPLWGGLARVVLIPDPDDDYLIAWRMKDNGSPVVGYLGPGPGG